MIPPLFHSSTASTALGNRTEAINKLPDRATGGEATSPSSGAREREATLVTITKSGKQSVANHDGWQWRKYGEKIVKGSPNPRSYYKCSHHGCTAKKIVERNDAGDILSTEYKGNHSHPAPSSIKVSRFRPKSSRSETPVSGGDSISQQLLGLASLPLGIASLNTLLPASDTYRSALQGVGSSNLDSEAQEGQQVEVKQEYAYEGDAQEEGEHGDGQLDMDKSGSGGSQNCFRPPRLDSAVIARRIEQQINNDSPSKRLDMLAAYAEEAERELHEESVAAEDSRPSKRTRTSTSAGSSDQEVVECLTQQVYDGDRPVEDGYKWRKYGQKQVKNNPFPRSYYKCTYHGCTVRKHVERSADDLNKIVVTYEGQHNHPPPSAARLSGSNIDFTS